MRCRRRGVEGCGAAVLALLNALPPREGAWRPLARRLGLYFPEASKAWRRGARWMGRRTANAIPEGAEKEKRLGCPRSDERARGWGADPIESRNVEGRPGSGCGIYGFAIRNVV